MKIKFLNSGCIRLAIIFFTAGILGLACQLTQSENKSQTLTFTKVYDVLTQFDSVRIILKDANGRTIDNIYSGRVDSLSEIERLPAPHWDGGPVSVEIVGYQNGQIVYLTKNQFNGSTNKSDSTQFVIVQGMTLIPEVLDISLVEGDSMDLPRLKILPEKLSDKSILWSTSNPSKLVVNSKKLTAKSRGFAQLTAKLNVDSTKYFVFSVSISANPKIPDSIRITPKEQTLAKGGAQGLIKTILYPKTATGTAQYHIEDSSIVNLSKDGWINGTKKGKTKIWAILNENPRILDSLTVTVIDSVPVEKIKFWKDSLDLYVGGAAESLEVVVQPEFANPKVHFSIQDSSKVKLMEQRVIGLAQGSTRILAYSVENPNLTASLLIHVFTSQIVDSVSVPQKRWDLYTGGLGFQFIAAVYPLSSKQLIQWRSSNEAIIKVDAMGMVLPIGPGTASVIALSQADSSKKATITISVQKDMPQLSVGRDTVVSVGQTVQVFPTVKQAYGGIAQLKWDMDGDGKWDDSSFALKTISYKFDQDKEYLTSYYVRDSEGNDTIVTKKVRAVIGPAVIILSPLNNSYSKLPFVDVVWMINGKEQDTLLKAPLTDFKNIVTRSAKDAAGNLFFASITVYFDTVAPEKPVLHAPEVTNSRLPAWSWNLSSGGGNGVFRVKLDADDFTTFIETKDTVFIPPTDLNEGSHTLFVQARDAAGNWSSSGRATVKVDITPPANPLAKTNQIYTSNPRPTFTWTSGGQGSGGGIGEYRYKMDDPNLNFGATIIKQTALTLANDLKEGQHVLSIQERDSAGNWSGTTAIVLKVDWTPPGNPIFASTPYSPLNSLRPNWSWKSGGGGDQGMYRCRLDNSNLNIGADTISKTSFAPIVDLQEGRHTLYVQEKDSAGNWSGVVKRELVLALKSIVGNGAVSEGLAYPVALAFSKSGDLYANYYFMGGSGEVSGLVKRLMGNSWVTLGDYSGFGYNVRNGSFALSPDGIPYVAVNDSIGRGLVVRYVNGIWESVGGRYFVEGTAWEPVISITSQGIPIVAFKNNSNKATVMRLNGAGWEILGPSAISLGTPLFFQLQIDHKDTPYLAYNDYAFSPKSLVIQKFNAFNSTWAYVGNRKFQSRGSSPFSFLISSEDSLYLALASGENADDGVLFNFDGLNWPMQGNSIFKAGESTSNLSLAISQEGKKFAVYIGVKNDLIVKVLNENAWTAVSPTGLTSSISDTPQLALSPDGVPYVLFSQPSDGGKVSVLKMSFDP